MIFVSFTEKFHAIEFYLYKENFSFLNVKIIIGRISGIPLYELQLHKFVIFEIFEERKSSNNL